MVTIDEMQGFQGWFLRRLGGVPVEQQKHDSGSLCHGFDLLMQAPMLVGLTEGGQEPASDRPDRVVVTTVVVRSLMGGKCDR
jgi:1-acyl-sn-glycerol-3-phosphate acyltransferase